MKILKRIFGPGQNEVWRELSQALGGEFIKGSIFKGSSQVRATVARATVTLDTFTVSTGKSSVTYTRMRAPFLRTDGFRFTIYRKGLMSAVGKFFGMQDVRVGGPRFENLEPMFGLPGYLDPMVVESGDPQFDADFIIKGNDEAKLRALFKQLRIRERLQAQPSVLLQIKESRDAGVDELYFQVTGVIKDLTRLKQLFELYAEILTGLQALGSAIAAPIITDKHQGKSGV